MESELVELCPICIENEATYFTECGHKYCVCCLSRIKKCAMCRKSLLRSTLCVEIKRKTKITNNTNRYSFAIQNPEDFQPSGTDDGWSRIDTSELRIYSPNYNVLYISMSTFQII
jgi:hypothetical protein